MDQLRNVYIAGAIRGKEDGGRAEFAAASEKLRSLGYAPVNPVELTDKFMQEVDPDPSFPAIMNNDLTALSKCQLVALLSDWEKSEGACLEVHAAVAYGIPVVSVDTMESVPRAKLMRYLAPGKRITYASGAVRDSGHGKGRFDLLPMRAIKAIARVMEVGAGPGAYGERNWEKGVPVHRFIDSAFRHLSNVMSGMVDEAHLDASAWNLLCAIELIERIKEGLLPKELLDVPFAAAVLKRCGE
jgi:hypothetical protein